MIKNVMAFGVVSPHEEVKKITIERRNPRADDVVIEIKYCGICHSDIHTARSEWGTPKYPCVPGHEIVGQILLVGRNVKKFRVNDFVGVGCFVDSCGKCVPCKKNEEQYCDKGTTYTYNSQSRDFPHHTLGGYSEKITVHQDYVLKIKKNVPLAQVAPLLCAGITTYSPLKRYKVKKGSQVAVIGLGGLGHMAVQIAQAMGADVTVFSTSKNKNLDAKILGAKNFILTTKENFSRDLKGRFDLILNTVSASLNLDPYLLTLKLDGTLIMLGVPPEQLKISAGMLIGGRKKITGSLIGGIKETQEMLNFCFKNKIYSMVEVIQGQDIEKAYDRTLKGDVKYRFVIDLKASKE